VARRTDQFLERAAKTAPQDAQATITWNVDQRSRSSAERRSASAVPQERQRVEVWFLAELSSATITVFPDLQPTTSAAGRLPRAAERHLPAMTLPRAAALAASLCLTAAASPSPAPVTSQPFRGLGDVQVLDARIVPTADASAQTGGGTLDYVVARVEFTNDLGHPVIPQVGRFFLIDRSGNRYQATDRGSSALLGIANSHQPLLANEKRDYTLGFRTADPTIAGTIEYDP
jgi:hypothetical protein